MRGCENLLDMARRITLTEFILRAPIKIIDPLVGLHPGNSSQAPDDEVEEAATSYIQEFEALQQKNTMRVEIPQSKLVHISL